VKDIKIVSSSTFEENEKELAKEYWSGINFSNYKLERPWSKFIATKVLEYAPKKVLEFGCNAGKNLIAIKNSDADVDVFGVDINCEAIKYAKEECHLNVACLDESIFSIIPDNTYDVVYTVSVLDHVPYPDKILSQLLRISKKGVLLLEPWIGEEGKVVKNLNIRTNTVIDTTPYSYSWDYKKLIKPHLESWKLEIEEYKLDSNLGRFYYLYQISAK